MPYYYRPGKIIIKKLYNKYGITHGDGWRYIGKASLWSGGEDTVILERINPGGDDDGILRLIDLETLWKTPSEDEKEEPEQTEVSINIG